MPRIRFHYLRHTSATLLIHACEHPQVIQSRLGRSNITTTMNTYAIFYKKRISEPVPTLINFLMIKIDWAPLGHQTKNYTFLHKNKKPYNRCGCKALFDVPGGSILYFQNVDMTDFI